MSARHAIGILKTIRIIITIPAVIIISSECVRVCACVCYCYCYCYCYYYYYYYYYYY